MGEILLVVHRIKQNILPKPIPRNSTVRKVEMVFETIKSLFSSSCIYTLNLYDLNVSLDVSQ